MFEKVVFKNKIYYFCKLKDRKGKAEYVLSFKGTFLDVFESKLIEHCDVCINLDGTKLYKNRYGSTIVDIIDKLNSSLD